MPGNACRDADISILLFEIRGFLGLSRGRTTPHIKRWREGKGNGFRLEGQKADLMEDIHLKRARLGKDVMRNMPDAFLINVLSKKIIPKIGIVFRGKLKINDGVGEKERHSKDKGTA